MSETSLSQFLYEPQVTDTGCCKSCGRKIPRENKLGLSKNLIYFLARLKDFVNEEGFIETKELYDLNHKGSTTAFLTQLKYFRVIRPYFTQEDEEKLSKRSGKWVITPIGDAFLDGIGTLPKYVIVLNGFVRKAGEQIKIDDSYLDWKTEDDIWKMLRWEE